MFVQFESADAKKREAVLNKRLMLLRCAYLKGWFDEGETEPMPEIIADGKPLIYIEDDCITCGAPPKYFIDGDCPKCNPSWPRLEAAIEKLAEQERQLREAAESVCLDCAGFGDCLDDEGDYLGECETCLGSGKRAQKCQHRNRTSWGWVDGKTMCLDCGEIIGRDLETGEIA